MRKTVTVRTAIAACMILAAIATLVPGVPAEITPATTTLTLVPSSGPMGTPVIVTGSNYRSTTCVLAAVPAGLFTSATCVIVTGELSGSFTVASTAPTWQLCSISSNGRS